ncbi:MAG: MalY/PatB family protein [Christensenellales bacterium]|jgi:cystathionine beta-lyase
MNDFYFDLFDRDPGREGTGAIKWDAREAVFGRADIVPLWVADMDFPTAPAITDALIARASHPTYGYTAHPESERIAQVNWFKRRHHVALDPDWILYSPGVVDSMVFALRALTEPCDRVLVQPPVYGPFFSTVRNTGRTLRHNPLIETADGYRMDFEDMRRALRDDGVRIMLLCNPHNPVGRVWTADEIAKVCALADEYGATIVVDEIHADFALRSATMTHFIEHADPDRLVVLTSATKTFNLAGLRQSSAIIPNDQLRQKIAEQLEFACAGSPNIFGALAQKTAYEAGGEWLDHLIDYLSDSRDYAERTIAETLPEIKCHHLEGTYLMWLDFRALNMNQASLKRFLYDEARAGLQDGAFFGEQGNGFMRLNIGTQRKNIAQALESIRAAIDKRGKHA